MGPVPEPVPAGNLSDEEMPPQLPIFLTSSEDEEDAFPDPSDYIPGDYPPGYLPLEMSEPASASSNQYEAANTTASHGGGVSSQFAVGGVDDEEEEEEAIDYTSVAGLMTALQTHGPTQVLDDCDQEEGAVAAGTRATVGERATVSVNTTLPAIRLRDPSNSTAVGEKLDSAPLAPEREEAVLRAMQGFSLPPSAIPPWAANLRDSDLTNLLKERLQQRTT